MMTLTQDHPIVKREHRFAERYGWRPSTAIEREADLRGMGCG